MLTSAERQLLLEKARKAKLKAYAPYSRYLVGAALLTEDGEVFTGANIENASYGLTVCAERTAVFSAVLKGKKKFKGIAVSSKEGDLPYPCGACRQVLEEFSPDMEVILDISDGMKVYALNELLPYAFRLTLSEEG